jgi:hypothetical protein
MNPLAAISRLRPARIFRMAAIGLLAIVFVALLPVAPAQQPARDLGTVRTSPPAPAAPAAPTDPGAPSAGATVPEPTALRYRPFIDPVRGPVHTHWYILLLPMSFGIAVVYKAVMLRTMERYWHQVMYLTMQIIVGMVLLGLASYLLVLKYVPFIAGQ